MQIRIVDVTDEIKLRIEQESDGRGCSIDMYYQGRYGYEDLPIDFHDDVSFEDIVRSAARHSTKAGVMSSLRDNQQIARLIHVLVSERGLSQTVQQIAKTGLVARVRCNGITNQANPESLPFSYDRLSDPTDALYYQTVRNWYHFQLTLTGDEVAFCSPTTFSPYWNHKIDIGLRLRDFTVKRLLEIYKADQSKTHLAWVTDLQLSGDLGL
jgi:hypothetical protein